MSEDVRNKTISDNIVFMMTMMEHPELAKHLIALCANLDESTLKDAEIRTEKIEKATLLSKGTRFDLYLATDKSIYDLEMQKYSEDVVMRARYYASSNDVTALKPGNNYHELKNLTIIFLCTFDPFEMGYAKYIVKERVFSDNDCSKDITADVEYDSNVTKIFFNASEYIIKKNVSEGMDNVIKLIVTDMADDGFTRKLKKSVKDVVNTKGDEIMTLQEHIKDVEYIAHAKGKAEGIAEGKAEGKAIGASEKSNEIAISFLKDGFPPETVAKNTGVPLKEVLKLLSLIK